ncbi:MAG: hypothetical protein ACRDY4_11660, partial [Acidimicrobiia bacterium]
PFCVVAYLSPQDYKGACTRIVVVPADSSRPSNPNAIPAADATPDTTPDTTPDPTPDTTPVATARCDVTVHNGTGDTVQLTNAEKGGGDRWDPGPDEGSTVADGDAAHWASFDPPPGRCHTEARFTLARADDPDVVFNVSVTLGQGAADASCDSSDDDYPCVVTPTSTIGPDGVLTAEVELRKKT